MRPFSRETPNNEVYIADVQCGGQYEMGKFRDSYSKIRYQFIELKFAELKLSTPMNMMEDITPQYGCQQYLTFIKKFSCNYVKINEETI